VPDDDAAGGVHDEAATHPTQVQQSALNGVIGLIAKCYHRRAHRAPKASMTLPVPETSRA